MTSLSEIFERFFARVSAFACAGALLAGTAFGEAGSGEPGLYQRALSGSADWTSWKTGDASTGATLVPGALVASSCNASYTYNGTTYAQGDNQTWAYRGVMYFEASSTYHFYKDYDDNALIRITGYDSGTEYVVLNDTSWSSYPVKSWTPPEDGWYYIDLRVGNGTGGKGPSTAPANDKSMLDAGLAWNQDGPTTCTTSNYGDWHKFLNTDDDEFLYTDIPASAYGFRVTAIPRQILPYGGVCEPKPTVYAAADKEMTTPLVAGVDYDLSWSNNAAPGTGYVIIDGHPGSAYDGKHLAKKFKLWHSMYDEYETVEYLQSDGTQRINTGKYMKGNHTFHLTWRQAWMGYFTTADIGWGCTVDNNNWAYAIRAGGRRRSWNNTSQNFDDNYIYPYFLSNNRGMRPSDWNTTVIPNTNVIFQETCRIDDRIVIAMKNTKSGVVYSTDPSLGAQNGTNYCSKAPICLFGDYYNNEGRGKKAIYGCRMVNDLTGETEWELVPVRRLSDGKCGLYDKATEAFYTDIDGGSAFACGPDTGLFATPQTSYAMTGGVPVDPVAETCVNRDCGTILTRGIDYEYAISNNAAPGTARIYFTGKGNYEGRTGFCDFTIMDAGPTDKATRYAKLSRAYLRRGLCALYDAVDNAGTGAHDPATRVWKDLGPYGLDATVGVCSVWADANCLRTTNGTFAAGVCPVVTPVKLASTYVPPADTCYTIEQRFLGRKRFPDPEMLLYDRYSDGSNLQFLSWRSHYARWYCQGSGRTTTDNTSGPWLCTNTVYTFSTQNNTRRFRIYYDANNYTGSDNVNWSYIGPSTQPITFGGRRNDPQYNFVGDFYAIRVYQKELLPREMAYNRAIDRVRYEGASLGFALPAALPDGYFYDATNDTILVKVCANALTAAGYVSVNGSDPLKITNLVVEIGTPVTVRYVPKSGEALTKWFDLPGSADYSYPDPADTNTVRILAWGPVSVGAVTATPSGEATLPSRTYVPDGLIGHWDAIDNVNEGHYRSGSTCWEDLSGKAHRWYFYYGSDTATGRTMTQGRSTFYYTDRFPAYRSIEVLFNHTGNQDGYGGMIFVRKNDYNRVVMSHLGLKGFGGQAVSSYWATPYAITDYCTSGRDNTLCSVLHNPGTGGSYVCDEYFYVNGAGRGPSHSHYNPVDVTSYVYDYISGEDIANSNHRTCSGTFRAMRVYDRELTQTEAAFNAAVDRVRYFGADPADVFPYMTLPDGYRWNASSKTLEVRLTMGEATCGTLDPETGEVEWYPVGEEVTVSFTPSVATLPVAFTGVPTNAEWSGDGRTATFEIACPTVVSAAAEQILPARSCVADGLRNHWDAIDNLGSGVHSDSTLKWYDLCGNSTYPWEVVQGRGHFTKNALRCVETYGFNHAAYLPNLIPPFRTLEISATAKWEDDSWRHVFWNRDMRQTLRVNASPSKHAFSSHYMNMSTESPAHAATNVAANAAVTYDAIYATNCADVVAYGVDGILEAPNATFPAGIAWWGYNSGAGGDGTSVDDSQRKYPTIGSRYHYNNGGAGPKFFGDVNAIRCYARPLEAHEVAFNAAVDRIRFRGAHPREEFPKLAKFPAGFRWNASTETLEVFVEAGVSNALDRISLNGSPSATSHSGWYAAGETVTLTAMPGEGRTVRAWYGVNGLTLSEDACTATFVAAAPGKAVFETLSAAPALGTSSYLNDGIVYNFDALEQPGDASGWTDVREGVQMSRALGTLTWRGRALHFDGQSYMSGYLPKLRQAVKDKSVTVQLFMRPLTYTYDAGYFSQGDGKRYRTLMLGMQGQQWVNPYTWGTPAKPSVFSPFGYLYYCCNTGNEESWRIYNPGANNYVAVRNDEYFGRDTLVSITRASDGCARLYLDGGTLLLSNDYKATSDDTWEYTCFGAFYGGRCANFDLYAFRVYDRVLTTDEMAFNNAVDRVRFLGDFSALPEGYRYEDGRFYAHLAAFSADPSLGGVAFSNGTAAASCDGWFEVGTEVTVAFSPAAGYAPLAWSNAPPSAAVSGSGGSLSFTVAVPYTNMIARARKIEGYSDENFTSTHPLPALADTKKSVGNRTVYWFTNLTDDAVYLLADRDLTVEGALVVGGGGAGGDYVAGGGGGGGVVELAKPVFVPKGGTFHYKLGTGGLNKRSRWGTRGGDGTDTTFGFEGFSATAKRGSGGGSWDDRRPTSSVANIIGSSGGVASHDAWGTVLSIGVTFDPAQGWWGASGSGNEYGGGGGGGADGPGRYSSQGGSGGPGRLTFARGYEEHFGSGGGGGAGNSGVTGGAAGATGAGRGGNKGSAGAAAVQGYGGGGGGGGRDNYGGNGSSGCVILSIADGDTTQKPLALALASSNVVFTGSALTPGVTLTDWTGRTLVAGTDYELFWTNNVDVGTGYVRADGKGDYAGLTAEGRFMIYRVFYAAPDGSDSNDGLSWASPKTLPGAISLAQASTNVNEYTRPEVWCKAGTISRTSAITMSYRIAIRGGFAGDGDKLADNPVTWLVGDGSSLDCLLYAYSSCERGAMIPAVVERFAMKQGKYRCVYRSGQTGRLEFRSCRFTERNGYDSCAGRGVYLQGNSAVSELAMTNCVIEGCVNPNWTTYPVRGGGAYLENWKSITMDNCLFLTNGMPWEVSLHGYYDWCEGAHIYLANAPLVMRNCEFRGGSLTPSHRGGMINMIGNCSPSAFTNCVFVGNEEHPHGDWSQEVYWGGCVYCEFNSGVQTLDLKNCTFAYNVVGSQYAAACVSIYCGTVNAKDCIFWGNTTSTDYGIGTEVHIRSGRGHFNCDWCLFGGRESTYFGMSDAAATISLGTHCIVGQDPLFVTPFSDIKGLLNSGTFTLPKTGVARSGLFYKRTLAVRDTVANADVHLRTPVGTSFTEISPAIDAGDPTEDCSQEPGSNGGRINLGAYGNTPQAEQTPVATPVFTDGPAITFPNGCSEPVVTCTVGSNPVGMTFVADVILSCGTGALAQAGTAYDRTKTTTGVKPGDELALHAGIGYPAGTTVYVRLAVRVAGEEKLVWTGEAASQGDVPVWLGHGGDSNCVIHVRTDATDPNAQGTSWEDAISDLWEAFSLLDGKRNEIWLSGDVTCAASHSYSFSRKVTLRGGFTGGEDDPGERPAGRRSTIDGRNTYVCLDFSNTQPVTLDGFLFTRGGDHGVRKTSSSGDLTVTNCGFTCNGCLGTWGADSGGNLNFSSYNAGGGAGFKGTTAATLRLYDSDFSGNYSKSWYYTGTGGGAAIDTFKKVYVDHCNVDTNYTTCGNRGRAVGLSFYNAPVEMTRTRFRGNQIGVSESGYEGCVCLLRDGCAGSVLRGCVFSGNRISGSTGSIYGILDVNLSQPEYAVTVENCTFAYNICYPGAALGVTRGAATVKNSIFFANVTSADNGRGADLHCFSAGSADVAWSLFEGLGSTYCSAAKTGALVLDADTCKTGDPLFVSDTNSFKSVANNTTWPYGSGTFTSRDAAAALDVHLRSHGGTTRDDGTVTSYEYVVSPGVDAADPEDDVGEEPSPNGSRRNLGGYGATPVAARSPVGNPAVQGFDWHAGEYTQPTVYFTLGGTGFYTANVVIRVSTDGGATWSHVSPAITGYVKGDIVSYLVPEMYLPGTELVVKVDVTSSDKTVSATTDPKKVWGKIAPWYGHGGDPEKVVHVRPGATGKADGSCWTDALLTLDDAYALLTRKRTEIWIAGNPPVAQNSPTRTFENKVTIRGGFTGTEDTAEERAPMRATSAVRAPASLTDGTFGEPNTAPFSWLDGQNKYQIMKFSNTEAVTLDRLAFTRASVRALNKTGGGGNLTLTSCLFVTNATTTDATDSNGKGLYVTANAAAKITLDDCVFDYNRSLDKYISPGHGSGAYVNACKLLVVTNCVFSRNGSMFFHSFDYANSGYDLQSGYQGHALYSACKADIYGTRFASNFGGARDQNDHGGCVVLTGSGVAGSTVRNCSFVGNTDICTWSGTAASYAGALVFRPGVATAECLVDHCTFAYNLEDTPNYSATLNVKSGTLTLKNSIFYSNLLASRSTSKGKDIYVYSGATLNLSYTMFGDPEATAITVHGSGTLNKGDGIVFSQDPRLVTTAGEVTKYKYTAKASGYQSWVPNDLCYATLLNLNVHLRSTNGYTDEYSRKHIGALGQRSSAVDAAEATSPYELEAAPHGRRSNLGCYGNTPWSTRSRGSTTLLFRTR